MKVSVICVGKLKEEYWRKAIAEYSKRLTGQCVFEVVELSEVRLSDTPSEKEIVSCLEKEAAMMDKYLTAKGVLNVALCIEGKLFSSEGLAEVIEGAAVSGISTVNFYIGSSFGLAERVKRACRVKLSMSRMTFPHQLARVMLCEQIYRAFSIIGHGKYHK